MRRPRYWTVFALVLLVIATAAGAQAPEDKTAVVQTMKDYYSAWANLGPGFDLQRIVPYYHEPLMIVTGPAVFTCATHVEAETRMKAFAARLRERGAMRGELQNLQVKVIAAGVAIADAQVVRRRADGQELEQTGFIYVLRRTNAGWKIAAIVGRDPDALLRLD